MDISQTFHFYDFYGVNDATYAFSYFVFSELSLQLPSNL